MKRTVEISSPGMHLHLERNSLVIDREGQSVGRVPLEDLGTLILGSTRLSVTAALLAKVAEMGGVTIVTGSDFQPEGALLPLRGHSTRGERIRAQIGASKPLQKRLWSSLVISKIQNQAALLEEEASCARHNKMADSVRSGDPANVEAHAARLYWPLVFLADEQSVEHPFRRRRDGSWPNGALNYGYAVLRAIVARAICGTGLLPEFGIHHHNRYDSFALASDLMEPYRPWVDQSVRKVLGNGSTEIDRETKQAILEIYDHPVQIAQQTLPLLIAVDRTAASLSRAFLRAQEGQSANQASDELLLPAFPIHP